MHDEDIAAALEYVYAVKKNTRHDSLVLEASKTQLWVAVADHHFRSTQIEATTKTRKKFIDRLGYLRKGLKVHGVGVGDIFVFE